MQITPRGNCLGAAHYVSAAVVPPRNPAPRPTNYGCRTEQSSTRTVKS
jgi:hypothetical protein